MPEPAWLSYADAASLCDISDEVLPGGDALESWAGSVNAAAEFVEERRPDVTYTDETTVGDRVRLGTARLAQRWFERRTSAGFAEFPQDVERTDPDIAQQLRIGKWRKFSVGGAAGVVVTP